MANEADGQHSTVSYGDQQVPRAGGGETHQRAGDGVPRLTTAQGMPVSDDQNTLRAGDRGPGLLRAAAAAEGTTVEIVAPAVGGVDVSDGTTVPADQQIDGAPSVLYDAVAILAAPGAARTLAARPAARDFVTDAVAHCKFIGYTSGAAGLFEAVGLPADPAGGDAASSTWVTARRRTSSHRAVSCATGAGNLPRCRDGPAPYAGTTGCREKM
jgi:hypothetical protein